MISLQILIVVCLLSNDTIIAAAVLEIYFNITTSYLTDIQNYHPMLSSSNSTSRFWITHWLSSRSKTISDPATIRTEDPVIRWPAASSNSSWRRMIRQRIDRIRRIKRISPNRPKLSGQSRFPNNSN